MEKKYHIDYHFGNAPLTFGTTRLIQLGRLYCMPLSVVAKHAHMDWYELTCVTGGKGTVLTNDIPQDVSGGDIYLSFPGDFHEIRSSESDPLKYDFFSFQTQNKVIRDGFKQLMDNIPSCKERVIHNEQIFSCVSAAIAEFSSGSEYKEELLNLLFEQIFYFTLRSFHSQKSSPQNLYVNSADELCYQLMHYIDTHMYRLKSLNDLSEKFGYNYSYLSDFFRKNTGDTLSGYYRTRRLNAAKLLLDERKLKIHQIAEILGYSSLYAFSKAFKHRYGISPEHYLKESAKTGE